MLIDVHTHISSATCPEFARRMGWKPFGAEAMLRQMDRDGVERSAVLPLESPEANPHPIAGSLETLEACRRYPDRLMPFGGLDPRMMGNRPDTDLSKAMAAFKDCGCVGVGEVCANLPIGDPRYHNLFRHAGAMKMPVLFHLTGQVGGVYGMIDEPGLTGLEAALKLFPETIFIGHALAFWSEIDGALDPKDRDTYPKGPVARPGRLCELMTTYPNLCADLSGFSGYNGVSRDPAFGYAFLERYSRKVLLGTDRFPHDDAPVPPILGFLSNGLAGGRLSRNAYDDITHRTFERLFLSQE